MYEAFEPSTPTDFPVYSKNFLLNNCFDGAFPVLTFLLKKDIVITLLCVDVYVASN